MDSMDFAFLGFIFGMGTMLFIWRIWASPSSTDKKQGLPNCPDPPKPPKAGDERRKLEMHGINYQ